MKKKYFFVYLFVFCSLRSVDFKIFDQQSLDEKIFAQCMKAHNNKTQCEKFIKSQPEYAKNVKLKEISRDSNEKLMQFSKAIASNVPSNLSKTNNSCTALIKDIHGIVTFFFERLGDAEKNKNDKDQKNIMQALETIHIINCVKDSWWNEADILKKLEDRLMVVRKMDVGSIKDKHVQLLEKVIKLVQEYQALK